MSKERAVRRAARAAEVAARAVTRRKAEERAAGRAARKTTLARLVPLPSRRPPASGLLAAKRRRAIGMLVLGFLVVQLLTWAWTPDWGTRSAVLFASLFAVPLVAVFAL